MRHLRISLLFAILCLTTSIFAQPVNDDCSGLIDLGEAPICPAVLDTFNNVNATASMISSLPGLEVPVCFQGGTVQRDVWFKFTVPADGSIIDFQIVLTAVNGPNGAMSQPQIAVYRGECLVDELQELDCATTALGASELLFDIEGLTPGLDYFLRINDWSATAAANSGDFVLCIQPKPDIFIMGEDTETTACSGTLFDSGGPDNPYQNGENNIFTICPSSLTGCINIDLLPTNIENNFDDLIFYEGDGIDGQLVLEFTGTGQGGSFQIGDGCVTVQFTSDGSITAAGFEMTWQCEETPCQTSLQPCNQIENIPALPFAASSSTCDSGDDVQTGPCGEEALLGEDFIYTYTPFSDNCINIEVSGVGENTSLSLFNACPEVASTCLATAQNMTGDELQISLTDVVPFSPIFIVLSNENCTDFTINISEIACPQVVSASAFCDNAYLMNRCNDFPDVYQVSQMTNTIDAYFQMGVNDGCWDGLGAGHLTWQFFQAQADGNFGFLAQNINDNELANIDIQVWGPIEDFDNICDFMSNNQPIRSTGAAGNSSVGMPDLTGLIDVNPIDGTAVTDDCESSDGDGFISTLPVLNEEIYLILFNDFSGNISNAGFSLDFSPTTAGVLNGLGEDSPFNNTAYETVGDAFYNPINQDFSCLQMTAAVNTQLSCAWDPDPVDFSQPFTNTVTMYFGTNDGGADGICMVYQQSSDGTAACGTNGGEIGAGGIDNSLIIEFDTWQNADFGDPFQDHIAVNINGEMDAPIAGPVVQPNLENGQEYEVSFTWDPTTNTFQVFMNGVLQITGVYDLINDVFDGSNTAICGYTASTGGANNLQYVCTGQSVYPASQLDTVAVILCEGESYFAEGMEQTTSGIYTDVFNAFNGCDSTVVTDLTFQTASASTVDVSICMGETIFVGGANQNTAGTYTDTFVSAGGCDSVVTTNLSILTNSFTPLNFELCDGESIFVGGAIQTTSGTYVDTLTAANGCDSLIFSEVNFIESFMENQTILICNGDSFFAGGAEQTEAGTYLDTLQSTGGCDSIVQTELTVFSAELMVLPPDDIDCEMNCTILDATGSSAGNNVDYQWIGPLPSELNAADSMLTFEACEAGTYSFQVTTTLSDLTCIESVEVVVNLDEAISCSYDIPNAFTPNGDSNNDVFGLVDEGSSNIVRSLVIYNRWGKEVHNGQGENHTWDGKLDGEPAAADVYIYVFEIEDFTGTVVVEKGDVTLIR